MAEVDPPPVLPEDIQMDETPGAVLLPSSSLTSLGQFERTPKGRTTAYIRRSVKMKVMDKETGVAAETPTTCFGDVEFRGAARRSMSKYIRLSNDTKPEVIYKLMIKYWKMDEPRLLISVTGGAKSFAMDPILKQNFTVGLSQIAATPGCWVISGGTNAGVMKHVGDAMQGSNACIGIATWGILSKREGLLPDPAESEEYVKSTRTYEVGSWLTEQGAFLDNNHSHFLLVDDGSEGQYGVEIPFRGQLEKYIMAKAFARDKNIRSVPSVLLVLEGGPGTLGTTYSAVAGEDPVPVVIVKGSGRAADLLIYALTISDEIQTFNQNKPSEHHEGLLNKVHEYLGKGKDNGAKWYKQIVECLAYKSSFTISAVGSEMDIDDAILQALLNDSNTQPYRQLQLALVWNRADLAREKIFIKMVEWKGDSRELQWIAIMALAMDNVAFVELLLEYGVSISSFLTNELLEFLYGYRSFDKSSPLRYEFNKKDYIGIDRKSPNARTYKRLVSYDDLMSTDSVAIPRNKIEDLVQELCESLIKIGDEKFIEDLSLRSQNNKVRLLSMMKAETGPKDLFFLYPFRELFFWAILNNMQGMAKLFWQHGEEHMAKSLIASHVCQTLADRRINQKDINSSLCDSSIFFSAGAVQLLDECYKTNDEATSKLITSNFHQFTGVDILKVAVGAENLDFVSHYSVQALIEDVWIGNLKDRDQNLIWVFLAWCLPPLISTFEFRSEEEMQKRVRTEEEYEEEMEEEENDEDEEEDEDNENEDGETEELTRTTTAVGNKAKEGKDNIERGIGTPLSYCTKVNEFYTNTPVVKFVTHVIAYVAFLLLFSYSVMTRKRKTMPQPVEWVVIITAFAYLVAEVYQVIQVDAPSLKARLTEWANSMLNLFDAFVICLFFFSLGIQLNPSTRSVGHLLYTLDCGLWWLRLLSILVISPTLGPYLVMIKRMIGDLVRFMAVLGIIIVAYGVTRTGILEPQDGVHPNINMLVGTIWQPYFNIYGELFSDRESEDNKTTRFGTPVHDSYDETVIWFLLGLYLLFTNILLLNLLIAVFNERYVEVQAKALEIWKFRRFGLILEYGDRHFLFAPFSLFGHMWIALHWLIGICMKRKQVNISGLKSIISVEQQEGLLEFECDCMTSMQKSKYATITKTIEEMAQDILGEIDTLKSDMVVMKEKLTKQDVAEATKEEVKEPVKEAVKEESK